MPLCVEVLQRCLRSMYLSLTSATVEVFLFRVLAAAWWRVEYCLGRSEFGVLWISEGGVNVLTGVYWYCLCY